MAIQTIWNTYRAFFTKTLCFTIENMNKLWKLSISEYLFSQMIFLQSRSSFEDSSCNLDTAAMGGDGAQLARTAKPDRLEKISDFSRPKTKRNVCQELPFFPTRMLISAPKRFSLQFCPCFSKNGMNIACYCVWQTKSGEKSPNCQGKFTVSLKGGKKQMFFLDTDFQSFFDISRF